MRKERNWFVLTATTTTHSQSVTFSPPFVFMYPATSFLDTHMCVCFNSQQFLVLFPKQYNFVGRILGPRGMTAKQLEQETGCKIMVRGKGSMRDRKKVRSSNFFSALSHSLWSPSSPLSLKNLSRVTMSHMNRLF
jgi:hypothetical protein